MLGVGRSGGRASERALRVGVSRCDGAWGSVLAFEGHVLKMSSACSFHLVISPGRKVESETRLMEGGTEEQGNEEEQEQRRGWGRKRG